MKESVRWARLPKLLARSALTRVTIASVAVAAVLAEGDLAQQEIAQLVDAEGADQVVRIDDVAEPTWTSSRRAWSRKPWPNTCFGSAIPADIRKAGQ